MSTPNKQASSEPHLNGDDTDWEALRDLPEYQMMIEVAQRSLDVFAQIGALTRVSAQAKDAAIKAQAAANNAEAAVGRAEATAARMEASTTRAENAAARAEKTVERCEAQMKKAFPSIPPPPKPTDNTINGKKKSDSLIDLLEAGFDDDPKMAKLKTYAREMENEAIIAANDTRRVKKFSLWGGAFVLFVVILGIFWAVFTYAVKHTNEPMPAKPSVELPTG